MSLLNTIISNCGIVTSYILEGIYLRQPSEIKKIVPVGELIIMYIKKDCYTPMMWRKEFRESGFELDVKAINKIISHELYSKFSEKYEVYCYRRKL